MAAALVFSSCHKEIWNALDDHENRISRLEELCSQINTNISSLHTLISALEQNDYVTSVTPIRVEEVIIGYTISFSKSKDITIYHGFDGADGYVPVIGVKADEDGTYYWTLDGEWLLDDEGNRIQASSSDGTDGEDGNDGEDGKDGADGITPRFRIEDGLWYVSYDSGKSWILAGKASGTDGDQMFSDITISEDSVTLTLADGTTVMTLPRKQPAFDISFEEGTALRCGAGETVSLAYTLSYGSDDAVIKVFPDTDLEISLEQNDDVSGVVRITAPDPFMEDVEVTLLISDGADRTIMRTVSLSLEYDDDYIIRYETNTGEKLDLNIPYTLRHTYTDGQGEIVFGTRVRTVTGFKGQKDLRSITIPSAAETIGNAAFKDCTGLYRITLPDGVSIVEDFAFAGCDRLVDVKFGASVTRIGGNAFEGCTGFTEFEVPDQVTSLGGYVFKDCDPDLKLKISYGLLMKSATNKQGHIVLKGSDDAIAANAFQNCTELRSIELQESVKSVGSYAFAGCTGLSTITIGQNVEALGVAAFSGTALAEFTVPSRLTEISSRLFYECAGLSSVDFGENIKLIGESAFEGCTRLESVRLPDSVESIGARAFLGSWIRDLTLGNGLESIGPYAFAGLFFKEVILPDGLDELGEAAFCACAHLETISLGKSIEAIPAKAFYYCGSLKTLILPQTVASIADESLEGCENLESIYCNSVNPPVLSTIIPEQTSIYVPLAFLDSYRSAGGWSTHASRIFPMD